MWFFLFLNYNKVMTKTKTIKSKKSGYFFAGGVAFLQGFDGIILNFFIIGTTFALFQTSAFTGAISGLRETFVIIVTLLMVGPKVVKGLIHKMKTKQSLYIILAGSMGTAIGNFSYMMGIVLAGSGYGVVLTALYPVFSMLIIKFMKREKENWKVWLGVAMVSISGFLFILIPIATNIGNIDAKLIGGMLFGLGAAVFWALEGFFIQKSIEHADKVNPFSTKEILIVRSGASWAMTIVLIMPVTLLFNHSGTNNTYTQALNIMSDWRTVLVLIAAILNLIILRVLHIEAINRIGAKMTAVIDSNNFIVPSIASLVLVYLAEPFGHLFSPVPEWWAFLLMIPIMIGIYMVINYQTVKKESMISGPTIQVDEIKKEK